MGTAALQVPPADDRSLMQCFEMFDIIHKAVS
eukprot:COSAG06_NODE_55805_length_288_cov_0.391534_1_plen_31_part_01